MPKITITTVTLDLGDDSPGVSAARLGDGKLLERIGGLQGLLTLLRLFGLQIPDITIPPAK